MLHLLHLYVYVLLTTAVMGIAPAGNVTARHDDIGDGQSKVQGAHSFLSGQTCGGDTCCCKGDPTGETCCGAGLACSMGGLGSCGCQHAPSPPCVADFGAKIGDERKCGTGIVMDLNQTCDKVNSKCNCGVHDPCNAPAGTGSCLSAS